MSLCRPEGAEFCGGTVEWKNRLCGKLLFVWWFWCVLLSFALLLFLLAEKLSLLLILKFVMVAVLLPLLLVMLLLLLLLLLLFVYVLLGKDFPNIFRANMYVYMDVCMYEQIYRMDLINTQENLWSISSWKKKKIEVWGRKEKKINFLNQKIEVKKKKKKKKPISRWKEHRKRN